MKKLRQFLMMAFFSALTLNIFGQASDLFFSEYAEGSSYNKYVEIYNGTGTAVDLSTYQVKKGTNGADFSTSMTLSGTLADGEVYVIAHAQADAIILAEADELNSSVINFNGDDAMGLFNNEVLIDVIGTTNQGDPGSGWEVAGESNGTQNHTLVRKQNICDPDTSWASSAGTNVDDSQWLVNPSNYWDNLGFHISDCAGGQTVALPTFSPAAGTYTSPISVVISCETSGADIYYTTDGSDPDEDSELYENPIPVSESTTVKARAYAEDYNPSFVATAVYTFPATVANLAELRNGTIGNTYVVTGDVWLTFQQGYRGQKYFQDETAGILIDDDAGIITSDFEIGDGIVGLSGVLGEFGGMMQFVPDSDPGDPTSFKIFDPIVVTLDELFLNFNDYEAQLVRINNVTFTDGGGNFENGTVYPFEEISDTIGAFRTTFYDMDYIGTAIPNFPIDLVGLPNSHHIDGNVFTSRNLNDFILGNLVPTPTFNPEGGDYEVPQEVEIMCANDDAEIYYTTDGSDPDQSSALFIDPINISETTTLKARAYADGFEPSLIATAQYNFAETVATLAELRAGAIGNTYTVSGEVWLTYQQTNRNQKFIQDATAGILIDDYYGVITSDYEIGDGITGLSGVLGEYGGMLQFVPDADPGAATSTGNFPTPQVVTIGELFTNFEDYESELVKIKSATFADGGSTFATAQVYAISDNSEADGNFRTSFYDASYMGTTIPVVPTDIIGLPNSRDDGEYITAREDSDLIPEQVPPTIVVTSPNGGEVWEQGETYEITWANVNFTGNVNVNITKPPFTNIFLAPNIANTGSWSWTIPAAFATGDYKIKVTGVTPGDPFDSSDADFTISEPLPDPNIVINEIMYNPSGDLGADDHFEYLELYNNSGFDVDISGWSFIQGVSYMFDEGTILADANYLVVARVPDSIIAHYGITNLVGPFSGALGNGGESLELADADSISMDIVTYDDGSGWPSEPDGNGPSLELMNPDFDNSLPESWAASLIDNGTPGMPNSVFGAELLTLVAPNGGETFEQGSSQEITWEYTGFEGELIIKLIDVLLGDTTTLATNVPLEYGLWDWEVAGNLTPGTNYKIMIAEMTDGEPMDESDAVFSVLEQIIPVITVTSPNGGEAWAQGTAHEITWTYEFFEGDVKVELNDGAKALTLIADSIPVVDETYTWNIPADLLAGDAYTIIISGMETGGPTDESDAPFSVIEPLPIPDLVINELMYNSPGLDNEWCEIYNREDVAVNLEGFYLLDSEDTHAPVVFPEGYTIEPGQYFTVSLEVLAAPLHFVPNFVGNAQWALNNSSDNLRLFDPSGQLVNNVNYDDGAPWPSEPDGSGPTLSLLDPTLDNSLPENWAASPMDYGTPGSLNFPTEASITVVNPNGGEELYQGTNFDITWTYANYEGTVMIELMTTDKATTTLGYAPVADMDYTWEVTQDAAENYLIKISDSITGDPMDVSDAVFSIIPPVALPDIVINEIMYNPPESGDDSLEYIEIYNNDVMAVNLENWYFEQGVGFTFPNFELAAGEYLLIAINDTAMLNSFGVFAYQWTSGGLSNGGEDIDLRNSNGDVIDYVDYDDGGSWTSAPDGYGSSLALIDPSSDNELGESWNSETVFAFDHPIGIPVYASPGAVNFSTPGQGILISSGWEGISTYLSLTDPSVANNMDVVLNDLVVMQDFSSLIFPEYGINTIGDWNSDKGYQLKLNNKRYTVLYGEPSADKTVSLSMGWNSLPVLSTCDVEAALLFDGVSEIIFVKEMGGDKMYWPAGALFTLDYLESGKSYFIKVSGAVDITFPECAMKSSATSSHDEFINTTSWNDVGYTAASHTFGIAENAMAEFNEGDVIGVFTNEGLCAGMVKVSKSGAALMAWADDVYTEPLDGFAENSELNFKLFVSSTGEVVDLTATYDAGFDSDGVFVSHGISRILNFKTSATGISETEESVFVYPNPTSGMLNIASNGNDFDYFEIYTAVGQKVFESNLANDTQQVNITNLENGFYFIKFVNSASGVNETINFIKN